MKHRHGKKDEPVFILRIQRVNSECGRVGFYLLNAKTRKPGKQNDVKKFGFFVDPQDALDVLKLVGAQIEADNAKLAREQLRGWIELACRVVSRGPRLT